MNIRQTVAVLCLAVLLAPGVHAAQIGMNYYHETMMTARWGTQYLPRSLSEVDRDLSDIKTLTNYVKLYANPLVAGNIDWVTKVNAIAKSKGMYTVVVMNTEDRTLGDSNWGDYSSKVLSACSALAGKTNEFIVGNEITLHSGWSRTDIKNHVVSLINDCKQRFPGTVSYEAFWYEKDAWQGYSGRIYFNLYERLDRFTTNAKEMDAKFGANAYVGEFGEDFSDEGTPRDENWQKDQLKARWDVLKSLRTPVAYAFTYREPSANGFGVLRPDYSKRPAWSALGGSVSVPLANTITTVTTPTSAVIEGVVNLGGLTRSCSATGGCSFTADTTSGTCRTLKMHTPRGDVAALACDKGSGNVEMYRQSAPAAQTWRLCLANGCLSDSSGFTRFAPTSVVATPSASPVVASAPQSSASEVTGLSFSASPNGRKVGDFVDGSCRTVQFNTDAGWIEAKACDKGAKYEMYLTSGSTQAKVCVGSACVGSTGGFASFS